MWLHLGKAVRAEEVERIVSRQFTPEAFASLCNTIAWMSAQQRCEALPSFTERVNVPDEGVDAEWQVELAKEQAQTSPLLGPGWNVHQYKKRDVFADDRKKVFSRLKAGLKGALSELVGRTRRRPERYVLFTNLDLLHKQKDQLRKSILYGYDQPNNVHVEIVAAGELAALLNSIPHVRSAFFTPTLFSTWSRAWESHKRQKLFGANVPFVGRQSELTSTRSFIDDPLIRVVVLSGPHNIGKTRLALEATRHRPLETIVALDPRSISVSDLSSLECPDSETLVIIEDPDRPDEFVNQALVLTNVKLLITVPTPESTLAANFGQDARVQDIQLGPLSDPEARELLKAVGANFDFSMHSWVLEQSGGNPGVLLFAASVGRELRKKYAGFLDSVAKALDLKIRKELGDNAIQVLRLLSLLTHVGVRGDASQEIALICRFFGSGLDPNGVFNALPRLETAGVVHVGGSYAQVRPPLFANYLATSVLRARLNEIYELLGVLARPAKLRFIRRLRALKSEEASRFCSEFFRQNGIFRDISSALSNAYLLRLVAGTVPEAVADLVERGLGAMSLKDRLMITDDSRRELVWALEQLLFRRKTSAAALRCLALLAEAETEKFANNATGVFCESFHPQHPQLPLPLRDRLDVLRTLFRPESSPALQLIGVKAIEAALRRHGSVSLRSSDGPDPFDPRPRKTWGEVWDYVEALVDLLVTAAQSRDITVADAARAVLPHAIGECAIQAPPSPAVARFKIATDWVLNQEVPLSVSDLTSSMKAARHILHEQKETTDKQTRLKLTRAVQDIDKLLNLLEHADYPIRLKRWAGSWAHGDDKFREDANGRRIYQWEDEVESLAQVAAKKPDVLTDALFAWLCSEEAKKAYVFFWWLGRFDRAHKLASRLEQIGAKKEGITAFSSYCGGLSQDEPGFVADSLDELVMRGLVTAEAIVGAARYLPGDRRGVRRIRELISKKNVDPPLVARVLAPGKWMDSLAPQECLDLLREIAGSDFKNAIAVIDFLGMWIHSGKPIEGELAEFAWQCLESAPPVTINDSYDCDQLATRLTQQDLERGFKLLEMLLTQPYQKKSWEPIEHPGKNEFWNTLHSSDRERALRLVLSLALKDPFYRHRISWNLPDVLDQEADFDVLMAFARENERQAEVVAESIGSARPGFWPIAIELVELYPSSQRISSLLAASAEQRGHAFWGPYGQHLEESCKEIEHVLKDSQIPTKARHWLEEIQSTFRDRAEEERLSEADEEINLF